MVSYDSNKDGTACRPCDVFMLWSKPSSVLQGRDFEKLSRMVEVCKSWMLSQCEQFIAEHCHDGITEFYGSDCTPITYRKRLRLAVGGSEIRRECNEASDFLAERYFLLASDGMRVPRFFEPRRLQNKTAWCHYQAWMDLRLDTRSYGHDGMLHRHFVYDRAVFGALYRHHCQFFHAEYLHDQSIRGEATAWMQWVKTFHTATECYNHDSHSALEWGIRVSGYGARETCRYAFVAVESLRQGYSELIRLLPEWVGRTLRFESCDYEPFLHVWRSCGVDPTLLGVLDDLQLRYQNGSVFVTVRWQSLPTIENVVCFVIIALWRWSRFTASRWITFGLSCRITLCTMMTGLEDYHTWLMLKDGSRKYHLRGFKYMTADVKRLIGIVALSSYVADSQLALLLEDNRLVRQADVMEATLREELKYVVAIPDFVFVTVGRLLDLSSTNLRHLVSHCSLVQAAYFDERLRVLTRSPWSDARKGADRVVQDLQCQATPPSEVNMAKCHELIELGEEGIVRDFIASCTAVPWTSEVVEQAHIYTSRLARIHSGYIADTLAVRGFSAAVAVLFAESPLEKKTDRVRRALQRLSARRCSRVNGRHMFTKSLMQLAKQRRVNGHVVSRHIGKSIIRRSGKLWKEKSTREKLCYSRAVPAHVQQKQQEVTDQMHSLKFQLRRLEDEASMVSGKDRPLRMGDCKFSERQRLSFDESVRECRWSNADVNTLREKCLEPVAPPPADEIRSLEAIEPPEITKGTGPRPRWLSLACVARESFRDTVWRFSSADTVSYCKFLFAKQQPQLVAFVRVADVALRSHAPTTRRGHAFRHIFQVQLLDLLYSDNEMFSQNWDIDVLFDAVLLRDGFVGSDQMWRGFDDLAGVFEVDVLQARAPREDRVDEEPADIFDGGMDFNECPWMLDFLGPHARTKIPCELASGEYNGKKPTQLDDEEFFSLWDELRRARESLQDTSTPVIEKHYVVIVRGGRWTLAHHGVEYDSYRGAPCTDHGKDFCRVAAVSQSATFAVNCYGDDIAKSLAQWWCDRMSFMCNKWLATLLETAHDFEAHSSPAPPCPPEIRAVYATGDRTVCRRIDAIEAMAYP